MIQSIKAANMILNEFSRVAVVLGLALLLGCSSLHKPAYEAVTDFAPDCTNQSAQIRYLSKLKRFQSNDGTAENRYNQTIDIQIERLVYYCANAQ